MTIATATETKTFVLYYDVRTCVEVRVERSADISQQELLASIDRDDIANGEEWSSEGLIEAWKNDECDIYNVDEDGYADELAF